MIKQELINSIKNSKHVVFFTGSGISAASGIPTFRDKYDGLWEIYDPKKLACEEAFLNDSALVWGWYEWRRQQIEDIKPNIAHEITAKLAIHISDVTVITQNIDDLHERGGSKNVIHLHGKVNEGICTHCKKIYLLKKFESPLPITPLRINPPACSNCGYQIRPNVVWFGEKLPDEPWLKARETCRYCDLMIIIGTSGTIPPASNLPWIAFKKYTTTIQINPEKTTFDAAILIMKSSGRRNRYFKTFEHKFEHLSPIVKANISS